MLEKADVTAELDNEKISFEEFKKDILTDYRIANESREASLLGRREVLTGKAKFGIFGDGKELAQIAMAKVFRKGDFRSGYYRDQTFMLASGLMTVKEFFAQLYANPSLEAEPMTAGRQMNGHYATRWLNKNGDRIPQTSMKNSSADISPTAGQMPRLLGLALASKHFRQNKDLSAYKDLSVNGNEVAFGTIGDASTSEGQFWETINAAAVLQVPMAMSVWDDGYGISVPRKYQTAKGSISEALKGFQKDENGPGILIFKAKAWNYSELIETYQKGLAVCRMEHIPVLFHIEECTQPQGHSTSGSHERYKTKERLAWEQDYDCITQMRNWIISKSIATEDELDAIETNAKKHVLESKKAAWDEFTAGVKSEIQDLVEILDSAERSSAHSVEISTIKNKISKTTDPQRKDMLEAAKAALYLMRGEHHSSRNSLVEFLNRHKELNKDRYNSELYSESKHSALKVKEVKPKFASEPEWVDGRIIIRDNYDVQLQKNPLLMVYGEDVGGIGGVNQTLEGMQKKYGELRVFDTGIREMTIIGQGIGMAMRGLRPIAEIQYLDYLLYAIQTISDDLATVRYRTKAGQHAPLIISTRGHRLEGVWHSGSPMAMIINAARGVYVCVPRNMTQAAGMYNTLLQSDDPAIVVEPLNGYRMKENKPQNIGEYTIPLGVPEVLVEGSDVTIVSYGSTLRVAQDAIKILNGMGIHPELVDVQTLLPFDLNGIIAESIKKTNKVLFLDEDVAGGTVGFMMQQVLENQGAFQYLDSAPRTLTSHDHRPAYGSDGDYFSKPNAEDIVEAVYAIMNESNPQKFPSLY